MRASAVDGVETVVATHHELGTWHLTCEGADELLFTENETNLERLDGIHNRTPYVKDAFDTLPRPRPGRCRQPSAGRHEGGGALRADDRAGGDGRRASPTGRRRHAADSRP